jgi:signal transduction histidine kinase
MLTLINDLLEVEKIKSGRLELNSAELSVQSLFDQSSEAMKGWAAQQGVSIEVQSNTLFVLADKGRIIQVLTNLLANAVKFSPQGGRVILSAEANHRLVTIKVTDEGRGVPESLKEKIFERFQQVHSGDAAEKAGSGLGLTICKAIVELHGGSIRVDDNADRGSTFSFTLPAKPDNALTNKESLATAS